MHVLIIGGAGFVGLAIAEALLARGDRVSLFDAREPYAALPGNPTAITGDVRRDEDVARAFAGRPDVAIYGAAITADAARDAAEPQRVLDVNLGGLPRAMAAARAAGVERFILLSSASAFGDAAFREVPLAEDDPAPAPSSLYSITKFAGEGVARRLRTLWSMDVRMVRLSAVFGPWEHPTGARDTLSPPFQVAQLALECKPVVLPRDPSRDWVYSRDVAGAVLALIDKASPRFDLYHVGPGTTWKLSEWAAALGATVTVGAPANVDLFGDRDRAMLAIGRLTGDLGYQPRFTSASACAVDYRRWLEARP
ncbi:MAG: NAD(P)-dependent oxidoreductase [Alphaproteobacteria bacterium]|nr:NAD(P)-dependent oxidoreductase [Alphaproteobacteria bacterium]MCW5744546.1 NAD(P)-dependent oxidoreductase [Alphaproteobacteria bacterium]